MNQQNLAVTEIAYRLYGGSDFPHGPRLLQAALHALRQVLLPLLYPPFLIPRRVGKPARFPNRWMVHDMLKHERGLDILWDEVGGRERIFDRPLDSQ